MNARLILPPQHNGENEYATHVDVLGYTDGRAVVELSFDESRVICGETFWVSQPRHARHSMMLVPINSLRITI